MYKDKEKAKENARERIRRYRNKGVTSPTVGEEGVTKGVTRETRHLAELLLDPVTRAELEDICHAFAESNHPEYIHDVFMGDVCMGNIPILLQVTKGLVA